MAAESLQFSVFVGVLLLHFGKRAAKSKIVERAMCQLVDEGGEMHIRQPTFWGNCLEAAPSGNCDCLELVLNEAPLGNYKKFSSINAECSNYACVCGPRLIGPKPQIMQ